MSRSQELLNKSNKFGAHNYLPLPIVLTKGKGSFVWDSDDKKYLDFLSSYSALNFGHQHERLVFALKNQAEKLAVCSRAFMSEELCLFEEELANFCEMEKVLPMNSGTEAVESALKIARKWAVKKKSIPDGTPNIIAMENNFHGRSISIVSFSTEPLYRKDFGPFTPGFKSAPFGNLEALDSVIDKNTAAILVEPVQAEAGILLPPAGYLLGLRKLCSEKKILLMLDEIQTGLGRTGKDFAFQHEGAKPDVLILGKSLGGGLLPISAVVSSAEVMDVLQPGEHGSTFGGNPLACAVAREALKLLREEKLSERATQLGKKAGEWLRSRSLPLVKEVRGQGLLFGIELKKEAGGARKYCEKIAQKGVLCKETHENVIRIAPPLTIDEADLQQGIETILNELH